MTSKASLLVDLLTPFSIFASVALPAMADPDASLLALSSVSEISLGRVSAAKVRLAPRQAVCAASPTMPAACAAFCAASSPATLVMPFIAALPPISPAPFTSEPAPFSIAPPK